MEQNVGGNDRLARLVLGPILLLAGIAALANYLPGGTVLGAIGAVVGLVFVVTGLTQMCPLNSLLGINTFRQ